MDTKLDTYFSHHSDQFSQISDNFSPYKFGVKLEIVIKYVNYIKKGNQSCCRSCSKTKVYV